LDGNVSLPSTAFESEDEYWAHKNATFVAKTMDQAAVKDPCFLCKQPHLLVKCPKFDALSVKARAIEIGKEKRCAACLRPNHRANNTVCKARGCRKCKSKTHHQMLCGSRDEHHVLARHYAASLAAQGAEAGETLPDPNQELALYLIDSFGDEIDMSEALQDYMESPEGDSAFSESAQVEEPLIDLDFPAEHTDGQPFQGPTTTAAFNNARFAVAHDPAGEWEGVNETQFRMHVMPQARMQSASSAMPEVDSELSRQLGSASAKPPSV
jgi:hypothetical protein